MPVTFALSLALTLAIEGAAALLWGLRGRDLLLCALVNLLTNPAVVLLHLLFPAPWVTAALELAAVAVEALYYRRYGEHIRRPWVFSLLANGASFGLGLLISHFFF